MAGTNAPDLRVVGERKGESEDLVGEYLATLGGRSASTVDVYGRVVHHHDLPAPKPRAEHVPQVK